MNPYVAKKQKAKKPKYNAVRVEIDGIKFASKKEMKRYLELKLLQREGSVVYFLRQIPFYLPGGVKYVCDFLIFYSDGRVIYEDVKGFRTSLFNTKKKQVEFLYPITITLV